MNEEKDIPEKEEKTNSLETGNIPVPDEINTESKKDSTTTDISQTENMEVHHHMDMHHKNKKWKEYFLEFAMLFLAVTLGFFAEQIRERHVEKERLHNYFGNMVLDIESNITAMDSATRENSKMIAKYDAVVRSFS